MTSIHPALISAARAELAEWQREAQGSRQSQAEYQKRADEHRQDAERAENRVAAILDGLKSVGLEP